MRDYKIIKVDFQNESDVENREVVVTLDNGTEVHIVRCYESWEQFGGTTDELYCTVDIADCVNDWLHGDDELPTEVYDYVSDEEDECESSECGLLEQQIRGAYDSFKEKNGHEPLFAQVYIHWDDIHSEEDYSNVTIKLNEEVIDEEDDDIMYYVNGFDELMSLCRYDDKNQTDFVIVGFEEFRDEL
jgi:hypothetical protein